MAAPELVPIATMTATLGESFRIKEGPIGTRFVAEVVGVTMRGDRINADLASPASADWLTVSPDKTMGTLDVRATLRTDDDAIVHVEYSGRIDFATGTAVSAPLFETGAEQYAWMNRVQAVGVGKNGEGEIVYELYEVRPA
ncbi:MAG: DUF3237 domain-containing protein [Actinomycetota bacterium]